MEQEDKDSYWRRGSKLGVHSSKTVRRKKHYPNTRINYCDSSPDVFHVYEFDSSKHLSKYEKRNGNVENMIYPEKMTNKNQRNVNKKKGWEQIENATTSHVIDVPYCRGNTKVDGKRIETWGIPSIAVNEEIDDTSKLSRKGRRYFDDLKRQNEYNKTFIPKDGETLLWIDRGKEQKQVEFDRKSSSDRSPYFEQDSGRYKRKLKKRAFIQELRHP